jgi:hypothetical protein
MHKDYFGEEITKMNRVVHFIMLMIINKVM